LNGSYRPKGFGGFNVFPPIIKNLLIINAVVYLIQLIFGEVMIGGTPGWYVLNKWFALNPFADGYNFQIWQLITYQFMHGGFSHILFNMFALWMFGMEIENMWGSKKFLYYYLLCGVAAGLLQLFIPPLLGTAAAVTIGASGAVYGVLIAFGLVFPNRHIYLYFLVPVRAKYLIGFLIILEFLLIDSAGSNVAHLAHLGGALCGFLYIMFDKTIDAPIKQSLMGNKGFSSGGSFKNPFENIGDKLRNRGENIEEAKYYDMKDKGESEITQEEIDRILDKISQSGYQNLSEKEKKILFEASKKMK
jgi:membrane associated rhomboid family serine protease